MNSAGILSIPGDLFSALNFIASKIIVDDFFYKRASVAITRYFGTFVILVYKTDPICFIVNVTIIR